MAAIHFDVLTAESPILARICSLCSASITILCLRIVKKHMFIQCYHVTLTGVLQASTASSALLIARRIENKIGTVSLLLSSTCKTDNRGLQKGRCKKQKFKQTPISDNNRNLAITHKTEHIHAHPRSLLKGNPGHVQEHGSGTLSCKLDNQ